MLLLKTLTLRQVKNKVLIQHDLYIGEVCLGSIQANLFNKNVNKPYKFIWKIKMEEHPPIFYADSIDEAKEFALEEFRIFINSVLQ